nr:hypothetical protein [Caldilineaceae bacterium]
MPKTTFWLPVLSLIIVAVLALLAVDGSAQAVDPTYLPLINGGGGSTANPTITATPTRTPTP